MIDIIGNIVISNPTRQRYFNATLQSLGNIENCFDSINITVDNPIPHGIAMLSALEKSKNDYFFNFEEDHFCVMKNSEIFNKIIEKSKQYNSDVIRTSFHLIEITCSKFITDKIFEDEYVKIFRMNYKNFIKFQTPYERYYLGTNGIFKKEYAKKIFSQKGNKPHDFELRKYVIDYEYTCTIPKIEILRAIDDDHGIENSCLLKKPTQEFIELIK